MRRAPFNGSERAYCDAMFGLLASKKKRARNRDAKLIANLAKVKPTVVYVRIDDLIGLLTSKENIVLWNALISIGHALARMLRARSQECCRRC